MEYGTSICKGVCSFKKDLDISSPGPYNSSVMWDLGNSSDEELRPRKVKRLAPKQAIRTRN